LLSQNYIFMKFYIINLEKCYFLLFIQIKIDVLYIFKNILKYKSFHQFVIII